MIAWSWSRVSFHNDSPRTGWLGGPTSCFSGLEKRRKRERTNGQRRRAVNQGGRKKTTVEEVPEGVFSFTLFVVLRSFSHLSSRLFFPQNEDEPKRGWTRQLFEKLSFQVEACIIPSTYIQQLRSQPPLVYFYFLARVPTRRSSAYERHARRSKEKEKCRSILKHITEVAYV